MTVEARDAQAVVTYLQNEIHAGDEFNITFEYLGNAEYVKVYLRIQDDSVQELVLDEDYEIEILDDITSEIKVCRFLKEYENVKKIAIVRNVKNDQDKKFDSQTIFSETTEAAIDKLTMLVQDNNFKEYTLRVPNDEEIIEGGMKLPVASKRANKYLMFDANGNPKAVDIAQAVLEYMLKTKER